MDKKTVLLLSVILFGVLVITPKHRTQNVLYADQIETNNALLSDSSDLSGVRVALYESYYSSTDDRVRESRCALQHMLEWMNATVNIINRTDILNGALWAHEVLVVPEGLGPHIERNLQGAGMDRIKDWIAAGGTYIGVRGSSTIAFSDGEFEGSHETFYMNLINGTSIGMPSYGYIVMSNIEINKSIPDGPDFSSIPDTLTMLWRTGRYFEAHEGQEMITLGTYAHSGNPAIVAARYGEGNVFASSPHFEYEEDRDRDGTDYMDDYEDPDSEWPFMLEICKWLVEDSQTVTNTTTWTYSPTETTETTLANTTTQTFPVELLIVAGGVGLVAVVVVAIALKRD